MRKVIVSEMVSLDGFFEGVNREIDWHVVDAKFNEYAADLLNTVDIILFGRLTYQLMANYWPTPSAVNDDPVIAEKMNNLPKIVFSKTLEKAEWANTRLIKEDLVEAIRSLKGQPGKDMVIFGSSNIVSALLPHDLIDEYRIIVAPLLLGKGNPLFKGNNEKLKLKLLKTKSFSSGNVLLSYAPDRRVPGAGQELVITRLFDAPRELVWKAWTDPGHLQRWWGPKDFTAPVCRTDFRVGGTYLYCMRSPEGEDSWSTGVYREIIPMQKIVATDSFADKDGNVVPATHYGLSAEFPLELLVTVTFAKQDSKTKMILRHAGIPAGTMYNQTAQGWNESFDKLADSLSRNS